MYFLAECCVHEATCFTLTRYPTGGNFGISYHTVADGIICVAPTHVFAASFTASITLWRLRRSDHELLTVNPTHMRRCRLSQYLLNFGLYLFSAICMTRGFFLELRLGLSFVILPAVHAYSRLSSLAVSQIHVYPIADSSPRPSRCHVAAAPVTGPPLPPSPQAACQARTYSIRHRGGGGHVQAPPVPAHRHHRQHLRLLPRRPRQRL